MTEVASGPSEMELRFNEVNAWTRAETIKLAEKIQKQVNALILPHKQALPPKLEVAMSPEESTFQCHEYSIEYDVETGELSLINKKHTALETKQSIEDRRSPLPIISWIKYGTAVNKTALAILGSKKPPQS